jgi:hypothetical protein
MRAGHRPLAWYGTLCSIAVIVLCLRTVPASAANYSTGVSPAVVFGVHEITLTGRVATGNPFDVVVKVRFTPASGDTRGVTVDAFYDGSGTWRARVYVSEPGTWRWTSHCEVDPLLDAKSGTFVAKRGTLRGLLSRHPANPRQWITADGRWFLHVSDTAYRLFHPAAMGLWQQYVSEAVDHGITSVRVASLGGWGGARHAARDDNDNWAHNDPWVFFPRPDYHQFDLAKFQTTDQRLTWLLDQYPDLYVQLILFGLRGYGVEATGTFWFALPEAVRRRTMRYMLARWSAFPTVYWLIVNDLHSDAKFPVNQAFVREVGRFFAVNDPWRHLLSTGPPRYAGFPFTTPEDLSWASYAHIEDINAVGAKQIEKYGLDRVPLHVFMAEDWYEQDHGFYEDPSFFFRWLIWSWTLAGGSANYGGRYGVIHPYSETGRPDLPWVGTDRRVYTGISLRGLDAFRYVRSYFEKRTIDMPSCARADSLVSNPDGATGARSPQLMACGTRQLLVYHPNAIADGMRARSDPHRPARLRIDLRRFAGSYSVEWYRPADGVSRAGATVTGGASIDLRAPWAGGDAVVLMSRASAPPRSPTR